MGNRLNGEYDCDIAGMIDISSDEALTVREAHLVKTLSGARGGEIVEAFLAGDMAVRMALAVVILQRAGKRIDPEVMWDAKSGWATWTLGVGEEDEVVDPLEEAEETETSTSTNGGNSSDSPSESQVVSLPRTGSHG